VLAKDFLAVYGSTFSLIRAAADRLNRRDAVCGGATTWHSQSIYQRCYSSFMRKLPSLWTAWSSSIGPSLLLRHNASRDLAGHERNQSQAKYPNPEKPINKPKFKSNSVGMPPSSSVRIHGRTSNLAQSEFYKPGVSLAWLESTDLRRVPTQSSRESHVAG
jgi:hypothetical protein